jgi:hypothetical protein
MHGRGTFSDPRLGIDVKQSPDLVGPKLPALRAYQHSLAAPPPPAGSFDAAAAERGRALFDRSCSTCHLGATGADNNDGKLHAPGKPGWTERTRRVRRTRPTARPRCVRYGSTRRIFTTVARPPSRTSCGITIGLVPSVSQRHSNETSWNT